MARKRPNLLDDPPAASSSEEEDEVLEDEDDDDEEEEESESDDGEEPEKKDKSPPRPSQPKTVSKIPIPEEDEDQSDTDSDSDSKSAGFSIRLHSSNSDSKDTKKLTGKPSKEKKGSASTEGGKLKRPAEEDLQKESNSKVKKAKSEKKESTSTEGVKLKRPAEEDLQKESNSKVKKSKSANGAGGTEQGLLSEKKPPFTRLWSEEDEIAVLEGMIEFHDSKGIDPNSDSIAFHEFVKRNISADVSKSQLMDKVRRLKTKYRNNVEKGNDLVFSRPHENKVFELSKRIWSGLGTPFPKIESVPAVAQEHLEVEECKVDQGRFSDLYPFLNLSLKSNNFCSPLISKDGAEAMDKCLVLMEKSKLDELEREWNNQILAETEVSLRRTALLHKQVKLLSECLSRRD